MQTQTGVLFVPGLPIQSRIVQRVNVKSDDQKFAGTMIMSWILPVVNDGTEVKILWQNVSPGISEHDHAEGLRLWLENLAAYIHDGDGVR